MEIAGKYNPFSNSVFAKSNKEDGPSKDVLGLPDIPKIPDTISLPPVLKINSVSLQI